MRSSREGSLEVDGLGAGGKGWEWADGSSSSAVVGMDGGK